MNTEIISFDSRQFYKELSIGTAVPNKKELSQVKHHFIQHLSIHKKYNAGDYEKDAIKLIQHLHKRKNTIIVVGGSGLYMQAINNGFDQIPKVQESNRRKAKKEFEEKGLEWLQIKTKEIDPIFHKGCDLNNSQRLLRALEVFYETGEPISSYKTNIIKKRNFNSLSIGLNTERELLYNKINNRVDQMIKKGLLEEVKSLIKHQHLNALQTVGYKEIFQLYNNNISIDDAIKDIKKNTRRYAKRQITWFKKDKSIKWFDPNQEDDIIKFIESQLRSL